MATLIGIGFSQDFDAPAAYKAAAVDLKQQLNRPSCDLILILLTPGYAKNEYLQPLRRILDPVRMIGAVTPAIILNGRIEPRGVAILGICSDEIQFGTSIIESTSFSPLRSSAVQLGRNMVADLGTGQRMGTLCFLNASRKNLSEISRGLTESLGNLFMISAAVPCTPALDEGPLLFNEQFHSDAFAGLLWGGQTTAAIASRHSYRPLGKPRTITHAEGNIIRTIDGQPAISIYKNYFGQDLSALARTPKNTNSLGDVGLLYPLGVRSGPQKEFTLRHVIEYLNDGSLICQGDIGINNRVHLMISDKEACRLSAHYAAIDIKDQLGNNPPRLIFIMESYARRKIFGRSISVEINAIKDILGLTAPMLGMYTYGEIAPLGSQKTMPSTAAQNASIVLTAIR